MMQSAVRRARLSDSRPMSRCRTPSPPAPLPLAGEGSCWTIPESKMPRGFPVCFLAVAAALAFNLAWRLDACQAADSPAGQAGHPPEDHCRGQAFDRLGQCVLRRQSRAADAQSADQAAHRRGQARGLARRAAGAAGRRLPRPPHRDQRVPRRRRTTPGSARSGRRARLGGGALLAQGLRRRRLRPGRRQAARAKRSSGSKAAIASQQPDGWFGPASGQEHRRAAPRDKTTSGRTWSCSSACSRTTSTPATSACSS